MSCKNILFDLDGTLINSKNGIIRGIEDTFIKNNLSKIYEEKKSDIESLIGPRIEIVLTLLLANIDSNTYDLDSLVKSFREYYDRYGYLEVEIYNNVIETLNYFKKKNIKMFIVTNKPKIVTSKILKHLALGKYFEYVLTSDYLDSKILTKSDMVDYVVKKYNLVADESCIVGDQESDIDAGISNNILPIFANYGYGVFDDDKIAKINNIKELINLIEG